MKMYACLHWKIAFLNVSCICKNINAPMRTLIIKTLFNEVNHLTTRQSRPSNIRKQLTLKLTNECTCIHIN